MTTALRRGAATLVVGALTLLGCASDPEPAAEPVAEAPTFCATFQQLAAGRTGDGTEARNRDEAGWDRNIATVEHIAEVAPDEVAAQAETYVQMVKDRKELAAANDWADVDELPADVRQAFVVEHRAMQQEVNELIAYAKANCEGVT